MLAVSLDHAYADVGFVLVWALIAGGTYLMIRWIRAVRREDPDFPFGL
jgi:hypothetical protein